MLLTPEDSQKLQLASAQGTIQFVLRSGADQTSAVLRPTRLEQLVPAGMPGPPVVAAPGVKHRPSKAAPASPIYMMEVIQGTQRSVQKF
jgi:Flp pilus assembly protein CpaB